ncbi:MAG TPA: hypothetical protein VIF62_06380 [Labilithrix sp.]|jgi:cytochrome c5
MRVAPVFLVALASCGTHLVPIVPDGMGAGANAAPSDPTFEVVARTVGVKDPLPVSGAGVTYGELEPALAQAVLRAVHARHDTTLTIELVAADADYAHGRLAVSLVVRATLRAKSGNAFVGQTQAVCHDGEILAPESGARVVWSCMTRLGRDISGWLDGLPP